MKKASMKQSPFGLDILLRIVVIAVPAIILAGLASLIIESAGWLRENSLVLTAVVAISALAGIYLSARHLTRLKRDNPAA